MIALANVLPIDLRATATNQCSPTSITSDTTIVHLATHCERIKVSLAADADPKMSRLLALLVVVSAFTPHLWTRSKSQRAGYTYTGWCYQLRGR